MSGDHPMDVIKLLLDDHGTEESILDALSTATGIAPHRIRTNTLSPDEWARFIDAAHVYHSTVRIPRHIHGRRTSDPVASTEPS